MKMNLSKSRAKALSDYLVKKGNIRRKRLLPDGMGETRLKNQLNPDGGENRRVEFVLVQSNRKQSGTERVIKW